MHITLALLSFLFVAAMSRAQAPSAYPAMAPLAQYLMPDASAEIALARTAAPASISDYAEVMVLGRNGYTTAVKGSNGFLCIVERSWATATDDPGFWNPKDRAPICFNRAAAQTFAQIYLMKTKLVLAGTAKAQLLPAIDNAFRTGALPPLAPGSMCYMLSRQQYLNDDGKNWHPHLMFFAPFDAAKSWGANLPGSPLMAADDPQEHVTVFMVLVSKWSDGSPAPPAD